MASRLSSVAADLSAELEHRPSTELKKVAAAAALLAVDRTNLVDPRLNGALAALRRGTPGDPNDSSAVTHVTEELDEVAWDVQERVDEGALPQQAYLEAFRRARASASVSFALDSNALEAVYEAQAAVSDLQAIRTAIDTALRD